MCQITQTIGKFVWHSESYFETQKILHNTHCALTKKKTQQNTNNYPGFHDKCFTLVI